MTTWRYQPVFRRDESSGEREYSLCEVYLDENDCLTAWTVDPEMAAIGDSHVELMAVLVRMAGEVADYRAVDYAELKVGMTFERINDASELYEYKPELELEADDK